MKLLVAEELLGALWPSFGSANEHLSNGSLRGKVHGHGLSLGKHKWTLGQDRVLLGPRGLHTFFSHIVLVIFFGGSQFHCDSHTWDRGDHSWKPIFLQYFPLKFFGN